jgi:hypothetical protein
MVVAPVEARCDLVPRTAPRPDRQQREQLTARGISAVEGEVAAVEGTNDRLRSPQATAFRGLT